MIKIFVYLNLWCCKGTALYMYFFSCVSTLKEGSVLPSPDPLLKFLVESSSTDKVPCANCDKVRALACVLYPYIGPGKQKMSA